MTFQLSPDFLTTPTGAQFSDCRKYRYTLWRRWSDGGRYIAFIGLNPSTADESVNDPTITRCINLAKRDGFDGMVMLNLFAFRATDPKVMKAQPEPIGEHGSQAIIEAVAKCESVVFCWGNHGSFFLRSVDVVWDICVINRRQALCWGKNKSHQPVHPLYQPANAVLIPF